MLYVFFGWWLKQLTSLASPSLACRLAAGDDKLVISFRDSDTGTYRNIELQLVGSSDIKSIGSFDLDNLSYGAIQKALSHSRDEFDIVVEAPPGKLLEKILLLPETVGRELSSVLTFQMERETPFTAEEVYWTGIVERRLRKQRQIAVRLAVVQRRHIDPLLAMLVKAGIKPRALVSQTAVIPIAAPDKKRHRFNRWQLSAAGSAMLALVAVIFPFIRLEWTISQVEEQIMQFQPEVDEAERLRPQIAEKLGRSPEGELYDSAAILSLLAETTTALPDDTELTDLMIHRSALEIAGRSASPDRLIERLSLVQSYIDPVFSSPVTKIDNSDQRLFSIKASLGPAHL